MAKVAKRHRFILKCRERSLSSRNPGMARTFLRASRFSLAYGLFRTNLRASLLSLIGCYAYYPEPREVFKEMSILRAEVLTAATSGNKKHALHFIPVWEEWARRLQVCTFLREGPVSPYRRMKAKLFRDRLEFLKHAVEEEDREEAREYASAVDKSYQRMRRVYLGPS